MPTPSSLLLAALTAAGAAGSTLAAPGPAYSIGALQSGNFSVSSITMTPTNQSLEEWGEGDTAHVEVIGKTAKHILAGTFKYQIYQTGVTSFIASGESAYYQCNNKFCNTSSPIALKWVGDEDDASGSGDFILSLNAALPKKVSSSSEFRLVLWGVDQDHFPYDFTATLDFTYGDADAEASKTFGHDGEKRYGPGGTEQLFGPGGTQPLEPSVPPHLALTGPVPWKCTMLQKKLCGKCSMNDNSCWVTCVRKHAKELRKVCHLTEIGRIVSMYEDSEESRAMGEEDSADTSAWKKFGPDGEKRYGPGGTEQLFGPGGTQPLEPSVPPHLALTGPVPWKCTMLQKKLCGKCSMNDNSCWVTCVRKHAKELRKVCHLTENGRSRAKKGDESNTWSFLFGAAVKSTSNLRHEAKN